MRPVYQSRIIEVFDASLGQVGDEHLSTPDARIQQHIKFRVGKLLVKCRARFGNDARRQLDMLLTNSGRKRNIIVLEDLTLPHDPIQKRDQRSSRGKVTLPHESVVCIKRIKRCVLFPLIIDTHSPYGAIDMMIDERVDRYAMVFIDFFCEITTLQLG